MSRHHYIDAFTGYLRSGDASAMRDFCENPEDIKRLAVYRNGFYKGCIDALVANFPVCQKMLGSDDFKKMARLYVDHFPPEQGTLVGYGKSFPAFIADFMKDQQCVANFKSSLPDIARLDYAWLMSLMSADSKKILTAEHVTQLVEQGSDLATFRVKLNASVILRRVKGGALSEWISLKINKNQLTEKAEVPDVELVMFWRVQGAVQARSLSLAEGVLMQALQDKGKTLGEAFDAALAVDDSFEVSDVFSACLQNALLDIEEQSCH